MGHEILKSVRYQNFAVDELSKCFGFFPLTFGNWNGNDHENASKETWSIIMLLLLKMI